jgi:hypothetical protein
LNSNHIPALRNREEFHAGLLQAKAKFLVSIGVQTSTLTDEGKQHDTSPGAKRAAEVHQLNNIQSVTLPLISALEF